MALNEVDKNRIDACVKRPDTVWEGIKSIITPEKYSWYLDKLSEIAETKKEKLKPDIAKRKEKWFSMDDEARKDYMLTDAYDEDLYKLIQQVAQVLGGDDNKEFKIGSKIKIWKTAQTMKRYTALKTAVTIRFTIEETKELLFKVLEDKEQLNFNPRQVNEMIYTYGIINNLPLGSVQALINNSKKDYLKNVFGSCYQEYYEKLITVCGEKHNILDAYSITKTAFLLAVLIEVENGTLKDETITLFFENEKKNHLKKEKNRKEKVSFSKIIPDVSVVLHCYDYANDFASKKPPEYRNAQTTSMELKKMFELAQGFINAAIELTDSESNKALYRSMQNFIDLSVQFTSSQSSGAMLSPVNYLPLLIQTELGKFRESEFNTMIKNVFIKHFHSEAQVRDGEQKRVGEYHPYILPRAISEHTDYYAFFFFTLMTAVRDLRAVTLRGCIEFWPIYIRMNEILFHAFFGYKTLGKKAWDYEHNIDDEDAGYTFSLNEITDIIKKARTVKKENEFTTELMRDFHIYENFRGFISRGKEEFIASIEDKGKVLVYNGKHAVDAVPLFNISNAGIPIPDADYPFKNSFYSSAQFKRQYIDKSEPYTRNEILKLAFWNFVGDLDDYDSFISKEDAELRKDEFISYFNDDVAPLTCCAAVNERNSLDRFLLLCLEHIYPIKFLEEAIAYNDNLCTIF